MEQTNRCERVRGRRRVAGQILPAGFERLEHRDCLSAGGLDVTFGVGGKALVSLVPSTTELAQAVTTDAQGRILVAGSITAGGKTFITVARLLPNGTLDQSFAKNGGRVVDFNVGGQVKGNAPGIAVDAQGRIVVAGTVQTPTAGEDFAACRLLPGGQFDPSFDSDGRVLVGFDRGGSNDDSCTSLAIDSHGRILLAGKVDRGGTNTDFGVARLTASGQLDPAFDGDGEALVGFTGKGVDYADGATGIAVDSLNRIVVCGQVMMKDRTGGGVARLLPTGQLDASFGTGGTVMSVPSVPSTLKVYADVRVDATDRIILAGLRVDATTRKVFVQRLKVNGSPSTSFGSAGTGVTTVTFASGPNLSGKPIWPRLAIDPKGRLVLAATVITVPGDNLDVGVVRLDSNGILDGAFGTAGCTMVAFDAGSDDSDFLGGVTVDSQGRILVAAGVQRSSPLDYDFGVARLFG